MEEKAEKKEWEQIPPRYMMATKALHKLGDISRETPQLCDVYGQDKKNFIGSWVEGFGFFDVRFPKNTTRELTEEEKKKWDGKIIAINDDPKFVVRTLGKEQRKKVPQPLNWAGKIIMDTIKGIKKIEQKLESQAESPVISLPD